MLCCNQDVIAVVFAADGALHTAKFLQRMATVHIHGLACIHRLLHLICPDANLGTTYDLVRS